MTDPLCCAPTRGETSSVCPVCGTTGKPVKLITLKALLTPGALATLAPERAYRFCPDAGCDVVYFAGGHTYAQADVKVRVYQKDRSTDVPVCYCFGHTRAGLELARLDGHAEAITQSIQGHIKAGRCGCEVNNPQGSCCLGTVKGLVTRLRDAARAGAGAAL
ncbi:hypothetical protein HNQ07_004739 [Deinococcus metalli]|uniref:(2Fe-2S)-binding protein n=1 Tax=Deinococcus metalli TaxID=1141878 RepID=A0A7W8KJA2_9DEIO|nr:copper chaperone Copz family protein [Deinococcus metalli]MBB5379224.1 hypothetical protein [Deinococcus metalli]GHF65543.1 (2Fe-2S)-binding protein [Deinococcus metalli]